jgi:hypothetical protein
LGRVWAEFAQLAVLALDLLAIINPDVPSPMANMPSEAGSGTPDGFPPPPPPLGAVFTTETLLTYSVNPESPGIVLATPSPIVTEDIPAADPPVVKS